MVVKEKTKLVSLGYVRTDLAAESDFCGKNGVTVKEYEISGFSVHEILSESDSDELRMGRYVTLTLGPIWLRDRETGDNAKDTVSKLISSFAGELVDKERVSVLTVCLGNRRITSDAVGPLSADRLIVTRHLKSENGALFSSLGGKELSVVTPGVMGETGIETFEIIRAAVEAVDPTLVICIDALAARNVNRLATTVQLTDTGISPGSGVGNHRKEISRKTLGVPVISIGVPTVVQSSTLVFDALEKAGMDNVPRELLNILENEKSFFVTPKNADVAVATQAEIIAGAINKTFLGFYEL